MVLKAFLWLVIGILSYGLIEGLIKGIALHTMIIGCIGLAIFILQYLDIKRAEKQIPRSKPSHEEGHEGELMPVQCPYCKSLDVRGISKTQQFYRDFFLTNAVGWLLHIVLGMKKLDFEYRCMNCKGEWK